MGISRQCAHRRLARFDAQGDAGLHDRSSRQRSCPAATPLELEDRVIACRVEHRRGPDWIGAELGIAPRTVSRILRRHGMPALACLDPMTGEEIRSSKTTITRYERDRPAELVHVDVKKLGKIPDGGGWRAHGHSETVRGRGIGYDFVHSMVDDHSRLAYSEIHNDEKVDTCAGFPLRAAGYFAEHGITQIERVMTDNAFAYRRGQAFIAATVMNLPAEYT